MVSRIYQAIANLLGDDKSTDELGDPLDFESGPFLDCGISWVYAFKRLIIPKEMRPVSGGQTCPAKCKTKTLCKT
ncbi:hypothetical protein JTB14_009562 [Gonioctena quinquepunctata]|nr:hypothetical protein JTB14_009562 [Gonioctena quinquepunctata]